MKSFVIAIIFFLLFPYQLIAGNDKSSPENKYVSCDIVLKQKAIKIGATGDLLISLTPKKGIHINLIPPIDIKFENTKMFTSIEKLNIPQNENTTYVDISRPIKQSFTLAKKLKPGTIAMKGTLSYFYCSDAEGWCSKFIQPIDLKITVVR
jgi:hypothetical protein